MSTSTPAQAPADAGHPAPPPTRGRSRPAGWLAVAGVGAFFAASVVSGALTPGYSVRREAVSALAARDAPAAPIMIAGFLLLAVGLVAAGVSLWRTLPLRAGRAGALLVVVTGALMAVAGLARQDCSDQLTTCVDHGDAVGASTGYWVHQYASLLGFLLLVVAGFLLARALRRGGASRGLVRVARAVAWVSLLVTVALVVQPPPLQEVYGLAQRLFLLVVLGWPAFLALRPRVPTRAR